MTAPERTGLLTRVLVGAIEGYRHLISPMRLPCCRFTPTCSQYAVEALTEYGAVHGLWLSLARLIKCGPWHSGGWDPIPQRCHQAGDGSQPEVNSAHV